MAASETPTERQALSHLEVMKPAARLDIVEAPILRSRLDELIVGERPRIVVDLSEIEFVDSAGLATLVRGMKRARSLGGDLYLIKPGSPEAMRIFDLTCLTKAFVMVDSLVDLEATT